jgi:hypothetical protein
LTKLIHKFYRGNNYVAQKVWFLLSFKKTAKNKQAPNRRKFAQSAHPYASFNNMSSPLGVKFVPRGELGPQGWTLSPGGIVYPQGWKLYKV